MDGYGSDDREWGRMPPEYRERYGDLEAAGDRTALELVKILDAATATLDGMSYARRMGLQSSPDRRSPHVTRIAEGVIRFLGTLK